MKELKHFSATWCQPCKRMEPLIKKFLEENPDIVYTKFDADAEPSVFEENAIRGVPAFIAISGDDSKFHQGVATEDQLNALFA